MSPAVAKEIRASLRALLDALDQADDLDGPGVDDGIYKAIRARAQAAIAASEARDG